MTDMADVPQELKDVDQWILWKFKELPDLRLTKVPCLRDGTPASVKDPNSWLSFADALAYFDGDIPDVPIANGHPCGIGFCFTEDDAYFGVDTDDCLPHLTGDALEIATRLAGTYGEVSPSGNGVKYIARGRKPDGAKSATTKVEGFKKLEVYDRERFFTVTGRMFGPETEITDQQETLDWLLARFGLDEAPPVTLPGSPRAVEGASSLLERAAGFGGTDEELIEFLREDSRYDRLWLGDTSDYDGDDSNADAALAEKIAWLVGPFPGRIERIFDASALADRDKWAQREDYRRRTIEFALADKTDFYNGSGHGPRMDAVDFPEPEPEVFTPVEGEKQQGEEFTFPIPESGIIRDMVDLVGPMVESPDTTIALGTLVFLSAVAGWDRPFFAGTSEEPCTLYVVICGPSAKGRKTTALRNVENVFREAFTKDELRLETVGHVSGRGLIELAVGGVDIFYTKEPKVASLDGEEREAQNQALADWHAARDAKLNNPPATVLLWDEFAKLLSVEGDWQRDTRGELLACYNGKHRGIRTSGKEALKMPSGRVQMALLGTMTNDDLRRGLNSAQASDGLMGRIIFTPDGEPKPPMAFPGRQGEGYTIKAAAIAGKLSRFRDRCRAGGDITDNWTTAARALHEEWYRTHYYEDQELKSILFGRAQAIAKKIACLLSMAEDLEFVDVDHVEIAQRMADASMNVSLRAAEVVLESQHDRYVDALYTALASGPIRLSKVLERQMLGAAEPGERMPDREQRISWIKKDPRLSLVEGEKGKGHRWRGPMSPPKRMSTRPPKQWCRECGKEIGRGWARAPLCPECAPNHSTCSCEIMNYDQECPIHQGRDPYDIPY